MSIIRKKIKKDKISFNLGEFVVSDSIIKANNEEDSYEKTNSKIGNINQLPLNLNKIDRESETRLEMYKAIEKIIIDFQFGEDIIDNTNDISSYYYYLYGENLSYSTIYRYKKEYHDPKYSQSSYKNNFGYGIDDFNWDGYGLSD